MTKRNTHVRINGKDDEESVWEGVVSKVIVDVNEDGQSLVFITDPDPEPNDERIIKYDIRETGFTVGYAVLSSDFSNVEVTSL